MANWIEAGTLLTIVGALVVFYTSLNKRLDEKTDKLATRQDNLEDCVEDKVGELAAQMSFFRESQRDFQQSVVERLSAIETHLRGGINNRRK